MNAFIDKILLDLLEREKFFHPTQFVLILSKRTVLISSIYVSRPPSSLRIFKLVCAVTRANQAIDLEEIW